MGINVLSLFDGCSCGRVALQQAGIEVDNYFSSEVDKHAIKVADYNWPMDTVNRLGDVRNINPEALPKIDLIIGGSPCQSFSFAGKQKGMSTKEDVEILSLHQYLDLKEKGFEFQGQSYLFWEYMRLLKALKPKHFFLENVVMSKKWESVLSNAIGVEPVFINSKVFKPASRGRLYWCSWDGVESGLPEKPLKTINDIPCKPEGLELAILRAKKGVRSVEYKKDCAGGLTTQCGSPNVFGRSFWTKEEFSFEGNMSYEKVKPLTPNQCEYLQGLPDNYTKAASSAQRYKMLGNGWQVDTITHIFRQMTTN